MNDPFQKRRDDIYKFLTIFCCTIAVGILLLALFPSMVHSKELVVAVIDSGLNPKYNHVLCKTGSKDFTGYGLSDGDLRGNHGTNIAGIISEMNPKGICIINLKYYDVRHPGNTTYMSVLAFREAVRLNVDVINYSSVGEKYNRYEHDILKEALSKGIKVFVPSGNEEKDLNKTCSVFPACYLDLTGLTVVGRSDIIEPQGHNGPVDVLEDGKATAFGVTQSGTSQATAVTAAKYIKRILETR